MTILEYTENPEPDAIDKGLIVNPPGIPASSVVAHELERLAFCPKREVDTPEAGAALLSQFANAVLQATVQSAKATRLSVVRATHHLSDPLEDRLLAIEASEENDSVHILVSRAFTSRTQDYWTTILVASAPAHELIPAVRDEWDADSGLLAVSACTKAAALFERRYSNIGIPGIVRWFLRDGHPVIVKRRDGLGVAVYTPTGTESTFKRVFMKLLHTTKLL